MLFNVTPLLDGRNQVGIVVAIILGYYIKKRFFKSKRRFQKLKPPFAKDSRTPLTPLETEQAKRDEILKKVFTKELATEHKWDVIVIGSGIGGLSSAALLSKAGLKVLVLEKHGKAGGACHIFKAEGYEFDVGIHYIGDFSRRSITRTLLEQISDGQIQWGQLDNIYDRLVVDNMSPSQRVYDIPSGRGVWKNQLIERFPEERKAIENFFSMVNKVNQQTKAWIMVKVLPIWLVNLASLLGLPGIFSDFFALGSRTLQDVIESLTKNKDLQLLFAYSWGTYGEPPDRSSFALQALLHGHYENGASYPVGGASEIPYRIVPVIERSGGRVLMKAPVSQILTEGGRVTGVRVGNNKSQVDIHAPFVISDAGIHNTLLNLLPESVARTSPSWPITSSMKPGIGSLSVFIGLKGTTEELGLKAQNVWAFLGSSAQDGFDDIFKGKTLEDMLDKPYPALFIGFPSAKDPSWESRYPGRSTITVVTFAPYAWFSKWSGLAVKKRGDEYDTLKNAIGNQIIDQVTHLYPKIKNAIDYFSVGTPVTNEHYLNAKEGAIYGLEHGIERFSPQQACLLRPETGIEGLFLSGQDVMCAGFVTSMLSGLFAASAALNTNLFNDLILLHKKLKFTSTQRSKSD